MTAAQQDQVIETRLAAIAPVMDMVRIDEACFATAGKAAAPLSSLSSGMVRWQQRVVLSTMKWAAWRS